MSADFDQNIILDREHLRGFSGGDSGLESEILVIFHDNIHVYMDDLQDASDADWSMRAHKIKGAARGIGAWGLAALAHRAETLAPLTPDNRQRMIDQLNQALNALLKEPVFRHL